MLGLAILTLFWLLGSRFILSLIWARKVSGKAWLEGMINNIQCRSGIGGVSVYKHKLLTNRVIILDSAFGGKVVVIGGQLLQSLKRREIEIMLQKICFELRKGPWRNRTLVASLFLPYYFVAISLEQVVRLEPVSIVIKFFFMPVGYLRNFFHKLGEHLSNRDEASKREDYDLTALRMKICEYEESDITLLHDFVDGISWEIPKRSSLFTPFTGSNPKRRETLTRRVEN